MLGTFMLNRKLSLIIVISAVILGVGFLGGKWQKGIAATIPTIPKVVYIDPTFIPVNSAYGNFTATGTGFIEGVWDMEYTEVRWYGPGGPNEGFYATPPTSINNDGTELEFTIPAPAYFSTAGIAYVFIDNHPDDVNELETYGPYEIHIIPTPKLLYLPIVLK